jgi:hypothetical protein
MKGGSLERAKLLLAHREIIFFEVWLEGDEDAGEIASHLRGLDCYTSIDDHRRIIRTFAPHRKPPAIG